MPRLQHLFGMRLGDAQQCAGGSPGAAVALLPIPGGVGTDADEGGDLGLGEIEFLAQGSVFGRLRCGPVGGFLLAAKKRTAPF